MRIYLKILSFTFGLALVLVMGAANALFMTPNTEWFNALIMPRINENIHIIGCLTSYFLLAIAFADGLLYRALRKKTVWILVIMLLNPLWCLVFFRLYSLTGSCIVLTAITLICVYLTYQYSKNTRWECFIELVLTLWYVALTAFNWYLYLMN